MSRRMSRNLTEAGQLPKADTRNHSGKTQSLIMDIGMSIPNLTLSLDPTGDGRQRCGGCDRRFRPDFKGQKFCDKACYRASQRSVDSVTLFWAKVNMSGPVARPGLTPCWLWTASTIGGGYGQFKIRDTSGSQQRTVYAHRYSWELVHGPIADGLECLHTCDVPACLNPDHLFLGTQGDNLADAEAKGRLDRRAPRTQTLTYEERLAIFNLPRRRGLHVELARRYGVTESCIHMIRKGRFARPKEDRLQASQPQPVEPSRPFDLPHSPFQLVPSRQIAELEPWAEAKS